MILFTVTAFLALATLGAGQKHARTTGVAGFYGRGTFLGLFIATALMAWWTWNVVA